MAHNKRVIKWNAEEDRVWMIIYRLLIIVHSWSRCSSIFYLTFSINSLIFVFSRLVGLKQGSELVKFNLSRAIFVDFPDERLDIDRHFKFDLNGINELLSINSTVTIILAPHSNKSVE